MGGSSLRRGGDDLLLHVDEWTSPFPRPVPPRRVRGVVRLRGDLRDPNPPISLDERGEHLWWPVLPQGHLEVDFPELGLCWRGHGYHDANAGETPLASAFRRWSWGRFHQGPRSLLVYDTEPLSGPARSVALAVQDTRREALAGFETRPLGRGLWGVPVVAPSDPGADEPRILHTLEDAPFYGRHVVEATMEGERLRGVTEMLSAERFARPWVRFLLPFRMRFA
ncbi:MAG: hypothetical protein MUF64_20360 [Polyangiaceae bacterium]|nr:hypothetical protein [Polyangiaceae bacterium]